MEEVIVCHMGNQKYLFNLQNNKYYKYRELPKSNSKINQVAFKKLKEIGAQFDWSIDSRYSDILDKTYQAHSMREHYRFDLYQTPTLPETSLRRALLVEGENKDIILVGDDDLVCVPLALLGHNVTVLDADEYLFEIINKVNTEMNLDIKILRRDLLGKIEEEKKFDVLYTDPISTYEGFEVFIGKGLQLLKKNGIAYITVVERFQPVLDDFCKNYNIHILRRYKRFCNSYNHKFQIIDDVANMVKVKKNEGIQYKYLLNQECETDFFSSQNNMNYCINMEFFGLNEIDINQEIEEAIEDIEKQGRYVFNLSTFNNDKNKYYFIYDSEDRIMLNIAIYDSKRVDIKAEVKMECNIAALKKLIKNKITHKLVTENQFMVGLPCIAGRVEMDINCVY